MTDPAEFNQATDALYKVPRGFALESLKAAVQAARPKDVYYRTLYAIASGTLTAEESIEAARRAIRRGLEIHFEANASAALRFLAEFREETQAGFAEKQIVLFSDGPGEA